MSTMARMHTVDEDVIAGPAPDEELGGANKKRRIWAACEPCRKSKGRCNGDQPCDSCISRIRSSLSRMPSFKQVNGPVMAGGGGQSTTDPAMEEQVMRLATELCAYDWNRKPRGPKKGTKAVAVPSRAAAATVPSVAADEGGKKAQRLKDEQEEVLRGAPRTHISAGNAYVSALQARPPPNDAAVIPAEPTQQARISQFPTASTSYRSSFSQTHAGTVTEAGRLPTDPSAATYIPPSSRPSHFRTPSYPSSSYNHVTHHHYASPQQSTDPRFYSSDSGPYQQQQQQQQQPPQWQSGRMPSADAILTPSRNNSYQRQPLSGFVATPPLWLPTSPSQNARNTLRSLMGSNASSPASSGASSHSGSRNNSLRPAPSIPNDPFHPSLNWHGSSPGSGSHDKSSDADLRPSHLSKWVPAALPFNDNGAPRTRAAALVEKLRDFLSDEDRPFVALALLQFAELDAASKLFPGRYLFGSAPGVDSPDPPAHIVLALLSLLAHRELLIPSARCLDDLERVGEQDLILDWLSPEGVLRSDKRDDLLVFARRMWNEAHGILLDIIVRGDVDPQLIQTGWCLDMAASEDGIRSVTMTQLKAWLFDIVVAWDLQSLDGQEILHIPKEKISLLPEDTPSPRRCDARGFVTEAVDREGLRRCVAFVCASYVWTQSSVVSDSNNEPLDLTNMSVNLPVDDDDIHAGSAWQPVKRGVQSKLLNLTHKSFRLNNLCVYMLHTPLQDLIEQPNLQSTIDYFENNLDIVRRALPEVKGDGNDRPLAVSAFMHHRMLEVMVYRLISSIIIYESFMNSVAPRYEEEVQGQFRSQPAQSQGPGAFGRMLLPKLDEKSEYEFHTSSLPLSSQPSSQKEQYSQIANGDRDYAGASNGYHTASTSSNLSSASYGAPQTGRRLKRTKTRRDPGLYSSYPLFELDKVICKALSLLDVDRKKQDAFSSPEEMSNGRRSYSHSSPQSVSSATMRERDTEGEVGTAAGVSIPKTIRAMRWPRHLATFARHSFAMASEIEVSGPKWREYYAMQSSLNNNNSNSNQNTSYGNAHRNGGAVVDERTKDIAPDYPPVASKEQGALLWRHGDNIIRLLDAFVKAGSEHARESAEGARRYKAERVEFCRRKMQEQERQQQQQ